MYKNVNGTTVKLSAEEEAEILLEWEENLRPLTPEEIDAAKNIEADIELKFDSTLKAFALVVLDEINLLRGQSGLQPKTIQQLKNAVKAKL